MFGRGNPVIPTLAPGTAGRLCPCPQVAASPPGGLKDELRVEQVLLLWRHIPTIVVGNLVNALLTAGFLWPLGHHGILVGFLVLVGFYAAGRVAAYRRHLGRPRPTRISAHALRRAVALSIVAGGLWGALAVLVFPSGALPQQMLLCFVLGGMAAGALASLGSVPAAANGYILASLAPLAARLALVGDRTHDYMVCLIAFYTLVLMAFGRSAYRGLVEGAALRAANAALALEAERAAQGLKQQSARLEGELAALRQARAEVKRLDGLLARAIDAIDDSVSLYDSEDRLVTVNRTLRRNTARHPGLFVPGRRYAEVIRDYYAAAEGLASPEELDAKVAEAVAQHQRADGEPRELETGEGATFLVRHFRTDDGGILSVVTDVTAIRTAEARVAQARDLLGLATEAIDDAMLLFDRDDRLQLANRAARDLFASHPEFIEPGRTFEQFDRDVWNVVGGRALAPRIEAIRRDALERYRRADGTPRELQLPDGRWVVVRYFRAAGHGVLCLVTDISRWKRAAAELEAARLRSAGNERRLAAILDTAHDAFISIDQAGIVRAWNAEAERIFGWTRDEALGRALDALAIPPEHRASHRRCLASVSTSRHTAMLDRRIELTALRRDGSRFPAELTIRQIEEAGALTFNAFLRDITERKRHEAELIGARAAADEANRAKSDFLASMSHEIRTPLAGVLGFADLLLDSELTETQRRHVTGLADAGKSLLALINDILDLSKIEAGELALEAIPISPAAIIEGAASILAPQIRAKGLELGIEHAPDLPDWILGDPTRVRQILLNLLSNALKFTDAGRIAIRCRPEPGRALLRFSVEDTGIGIRDDQRELLFRPFKQLDRSTTRRHGGTGLGLSICKRLAEAMGGGVGAVSSPGQGSTFWFTIALTPACAPAARAAEPERPGAASPARILVAEDVAVNQMIIEGLLRRLGHEVTSVRNGAEAVAAVETAPFDLVLMDMEMPVMDGIAATRAIRASGGPGRDLPIVALTANAMLEDAAACREAGMNDFMSKPIDRAKLAQTIDRWCRHGRSVPAEPRGQAPQVLDPTVLDPTVLDGLAALIGPDRTAGLCDMLRQRLSETIPLFADHNDRAAMAAEAHELIAMAGNLGCTELTERARALSTALRQRQPGYDSLARALVGAADRALEALERRFAA